MFAGGLHDAMLLLVTEPLASWLGAVVEPGNVSTTLGSCRRGGDKVFGHWPDGPEHTHRQTRSAAVAAGEKRYGQQGGNSCR